MSDELRDKLEPCPFCGGKPTYCLNEGYMDYCELIECAECGTTTPHKFRTRYEAIEEWNTRPAVEALRAEVTMLRNENAFLFAGGDANGEIVRQLRTEVERLEKADEAHRDHIDMLHRDQKPLLDNFAALEDKNAKLREALEMAVGRDWDATCPSTEEYEQVEQALASRKGAEG